METPGRRLILDLLAKSVAKINAACSDETSDDKKAVESKTQLVVIKMKTICNEKGSNIKKIKDECNYVKGQDPVKLKQVKTVVKKEYIEADVNLIREIKQSDTKQVEMKQEYVERNIENEKEVKLLYGITKNETTSNKISNTADTAGRKLNLGLLAKSVSNINAVESGNICLKVEGKEELLLTKQRRKENDDRTLNTQIPYLERQKKRKLLPLKENPKSFKIDSELKRKSFKIKVEDSKVESWKDDINPIEGFSHLKKVSVSNSKLKVEHAESKHDNGAETKKHRNRKACLKLNRFSPKEDEIILHAMNTFGDNISASKLALKMNRVCRSVSCRIENLRAGKKVSRSFTLIEDLVIMDGVMKQLPGEGLAKLDLPSFGDWKDIGTQFDRKPSHVKNRWEYYLKPWLLQHLAGTLNLDIRRMLANHLADNFEDVNSIDWPFVADRPEFAGHTEVSLHYYFGAYLFQRSKQWVNGAVEEVTLKLIAENENELFQNNRIRKVPDKVLKRQEDIICYFEQYAKSKSINIFQLSLK